MDRKTIVEISRFAGVSIATVSRVINGHPHVSPKTRARVIKIMEKYGYRPNPLARRMGRGRTKTIGVLTHAGSDTKAHYFMEVFRGINSALGGSLYNVLVNPSEFDVDGLLALAPSIGEPYLGLAARARIPTVVISSTSQTVSSVDLDNTAAAYEMVTHLIRLGHRRVACIGGPMNVSNSRDRLDGYQKALKAHDIRPDGALIAHGDFEQTSGQDIMTEFLKLKNPPTAVFAANDHMAIGAVRVIQHRGLRVPLDIAVAGFDDADFSAFVTPTLTTVRQPLFQMGYEAARLLMDQLNAPKPLPIRRVLMEGKLVIRESCGAYAARPLPETGRELPGPKKEPK